VDPDNGNIHVMFYDTRDDLARRKTNVYYLASKDGGLTWTDETKITSEQTDETTTGADMGNQYGDYNGIVAFKDVAFPSWTDRRSSNPILKEQIYTAAVDRSKTVDIEKAISLMNIEASSSALREDAGRAAYHREWEPQVPPGTRLDSLSKKLSERVSTLPARDAEDRTPLPPWFRVYLRNKFPNLPKKGKYQYPRAARRILQQLLANPNSIAVP
jgi:hypothetical protein